MNISDYISYHEDFYRQVELIPEENYFTTQIQLENIPEIENSKYGFQHITSLGEQPIRLISKRIQLADIEKNLNPFAINFFERVSTGYGKTFYEKENTIVWGFERLGIFIEYDAEKIVTNIWITNSPAFIMDFNGMKLYTALYNLGLNYRLLLIDWNKKLVIRLSNKNNLKNYLRETYNFTIESK